MKQLPHPDRFEDSKMSFGEHLEELRSALWKGVLALAIGFGVGLFFGDDLIRFVQEPLTLELKELTAKQRLRRYMEHLPVGAEANQGAIDRGLVPETYYIDPRVLLESLGQGQPGGAPAEGGEIGPAPDEPRAGMEPLVLWRQLDEDPNVRTISTDTTEGFTVYVKASLVLGVVLASPFVFYFVWSFVAAGLYPHERRYVHLFMPISIGLFLLGSTVAFFFALKYVLAFLFQFYDWMGIVPTPRISEWLGFVLLLPLMFGLAFQLPLVMLFLERIGVATVAGYMKYWRHAVIVIFIVSMLLTPSDPQSLLMLAGFLTPLYFAGILLCKYLPRSTGGAFDTP